MSDSNIKNKKIIFIYIFQKISDCLSKNGCNKLNKYNYISADEIYDNLHREFQLSENEFKNILNILRKRFPLQYKYLNINKKWKNNIKKD